MKLDEMFDAGISVRKTVWSKRGDKIARKEVERIAATDVQPRTHIEITSAEEHDGGHE